MIAKFLISGNPPKISSNLQKGSCFSGIEESRMVIRRYNPIAMLSSSVFTPFPRQQFYRCPFPIFTQSLQPFPSLLSSTLPRHFTLSFYSNTAQTSTADTPDELHHQLSNSKQVKFLSLSFLISIFDFLSWF